MKTLLEFRDVTLARAEEEVSRELVLRIPVSDKLRSELASRALEHAAEAESDDEAHAREPATVQHVLPTDEHRPDDASAQQVRRVRIASSFQLAD